MDKGLALPVIAGLAVGITLILLFSFYLGISRDTVTGTTKSGVTISLAGLKDQYETSEPLNFTVTAKGHGSFCGYDPTAKILNGVSGKVVYHTPVSNIIVDCLPEPVDVHNTWTFYDIAYPDAAVVIGETGRYRLVVELQGVVLEKPFVVNKDLMSP